MVACGSVASRQLLVQTRGPAAVVRPSDGAGRRRDVPRHAQAQQPCVPRHCCTTTTIHGTCPELSVASAANVDSCPSTAATARCCCSERADQAHSHAGAPEKPCACALSSCRGCSSMCRCCRSFRAPRSTPLMLSKPKHPGWTPCSRWDGVRRQQLPMCTAAGCCCCCCVARTLCCLRLLTIMRALLLLVVNHSAQQSPPSTRPTASCLGARAGAARWRMASACWSSTSRCAPPAALMLISSAAGGNDLRCRHHHHQQQVCTRAALPAWMPSFACLRRSARATCRRVCCCCAT